MIEQTVIEPMIEMPELAAGRRYLLIENSKHLRAHIARYIGRTVKTIDGLSRLADEFIDLREGRQLLVIHWRGITLECLP